MAAQENNNGQVREPWTAYGLSSSTINGKPEEIAIHSLQQLAEEEAAYMATLTGEQHLANALKLIKAIYKEELKEPFDKNIRTR